MDPLKSKKTREEEFEIRPSDLNQCVVRVILVSGVVVWSWIHASSGHTAGVFNSAFFTLSLGYWAFSCALFVWTYFVLERFGSLHGLLTATRILGILADLGAISAYSALSGGHGVVLYPVYLTCVIGYGYRFGIRYLYLALAIAVLFLALAVSQNQYLSANRSLVIGYFLGLFLVPLYSAALLKKHREILERLKEVNMARSRFIANMSHELRTPLHAIISISDVLSESASADSNAEIDSKRKLSIIGDSAKHLLDLVNRILDVASSDSRKQNRDQLDTVDFYDLLVAALRICEPKADEKNLALDWYVAPEVPRLIHSSRERIEEILINTIGNAVKYTNSGHVYVHAFTESIEGASHLCIVISDTGIGISEKLLPNIFEPFTLGDDSTARKYSGTGLGLTITKQCVEYLEGSIEYVSEIDIGTRCTVRIPLYSAKETTDLQTAEMTEAVILSRRPVAVEELERFEAAGFKCEWRNDLSFDYVGSTETALFIDASFQEHYAVILQRLATARNGQLVVEYRPSGHERNNSERGFNSFVGRPTLQSLRNVRSLCAALATRSVGEGAATQGYSDGRVCRVLVADDNNLNLSAARLALEAVGHEVTTATNGEEALRHLDLGHFDVAFFDMHMPGMSGIEAAKIYQFVASEDDQCPIVILTADATEAAREAATEAGAAGFITKPVGAYTLRDAVFTYGRDAPVIDAASENRDDIEGGRDSIAEDAAVDLALIRELMSLQVDGDEVREMVEEFRTEARSIVKSAVRAAKNDRVMEVQDLMHALRGAASTVGATQLAKLAGEIESQSASRQRTAMIECAFAIQSTIEASADRIAAELTTNEL